MKIILLINVACLTTSISAMNILIEKHDSSKDASQEVSAQTDAKSMPVQKLQVQAIQGELLTYSNRIKSWQVQRGFAYKTSQLIQQALNYARFCDDWSFMEIRKEQYLIDSTFGKGACTENVSINGKVIEALASKNLRDKIAIALKIGVEGSRVWLLNALRSKQITLAHFRFPNLTPLTFIAECTDLYTHDKLAELMKACIEQGAQVNEHNNLGELPLIQSARHNDPKSIEVLLNAGADINARNDSQETALMAAARSGSPSAIRILLERSADRTLKNHCGKNALEIAIATNYDCEASRKTIELLSN